MLSIMKLSLFLRTVMQSNDPSNDMPTLTQSSDLDIMIGDRSLPWLLLAFPVLLARIVRFWACSPTPKDE